MIIKVLGTGCSKCEKLKKNVEEAVKLAGVEAEIIKVEDIREIMSFGVMQTPALVIDEKLVSKGKVLKSKEIAGMLR